MVRREMAGRHDGRNQVAFREGGGGGRSSRGRRGAGAGAEGLSIISLAKNDGVSVSPIDRIAGGADGRPH